MVDNELKIFSENWIAQNVGVSRETVRLYVKKGYITPKQPDYKVLYSRKDVQKIIYVKMLIDIGYTHADIEKIGRGKIDFCDGVTKKIDELKKEKEKIDMLIGVSEMIKLTGEVPICKCKGVDKITYLGFIKKVKEEWNLRTMGKGSLVKEVVCEGVSNYYNYLKYIGLGELEDESNLTLLRFYVLQMYKKILEGADESEISKNIENRYHFEYKIFKKVSEDCSYLDFLKQCVKFLYAEGDLVCDEQNKLGKDKFKWYRKLVKEYYEKCKFKNL